MSQVLNQNHEHPSANTVF